MSKKNKPFQPLGVNALFALGGGYSTAKHEQLTHTQVDALNWAMSSEGKYARQIMEWNKGYLGGNCEQDVQELGVKLTYGTTERNNGFCVVWVKPPSQREEKP
jgi:hypothetical protein